MGIAPMFGYSVGLDGVAAAIDEARQATSPPRIVGIPD